MKHLGDITKISGRDAPTVNVIIGGSPCQDLSIAGKRAGLGGQRSGLFMEQIRIIKEMREKDAESGRTGANIRPRFMVWENVPGAFSVNGGADFAAVLEETIKVSEPEIPAILPPANGWATSGCFLGRGWSVAWRVLDAQFWGVPQRRRRIALVADFGGGCAPEILFERESVSRHSESGETAWQRTAGDAADSTGTASGVICLNPHDSQSARVYDANGVWHSLNANSNGGQSRDAVFCLQGNGIDRSDNAGCNGKGWTDGNCYTLNTVDRPAVCYAKTTKPHSKDEAPTIKETEISPTLSTFDVGEARTNTFVCFESHGQDSRYRPLGETSETISAKYWMGGGNQPIVVAFDQLKHGQFGIGERASTLTAHLEKEARDIECAAVDIRNGSENPSINGTLQAKENGGTSLNLNNEVRQRYIVRRLTPLECERLQGYPDGWTDIGEWTDTKGKKHKAADSPRYKALGNSIAIPPWLWVLSRLNAYCEEKTMASLFDGIGGFPLIWEYLNGTGSAVWCSEIEEFPIAVTKRRLGDE